MSGGSWFLIRCPGSIGRYLTLTGVSIGAADALMARLATHHGAYAALDGRVAARGAADRLDAAVVGEIIDAHAVVPNGGTLAERKEDIARLFGDDDLDVVVAAVEAAASNSDWIAEARSARSGASPTTLRAPGRGVWEGRGQSVEGGRADEHRQGGGDAGGQ